MTSETEKDKSKRGCSYLAIRLGVFLIVMIGVVNVLKWVFHLIFPYTDITTHLIPFQNDYLAFTDSFITSEGMSSEFTDDMGIVGRFLGGCIPALMGGIIINVILYIIPFTRKAINYIVYILYLPAAIVVLIYAGFFPRVKSTFDVENRQLHITHHKWFFIPARKSIPFADITGYDFKFEDLSSYSHGTHGEYAIIYVITKDGAHFIGENQIGTHSSVDDWKPVQEDHEKIKKVIQTIEQLTGVLSREVASPDPLK
jgi:hypothetical protein